MIPLEFRDSWALCPAGLSDADHQDGLDRAGRCDACGAEAVCCGACGELGVTTEDHDCCLDDRPRLVGCSTTCYTSPIDFHPERLTSTVNSVPVFDPQGHLLAHVPPTYLDRALARNEVAIGDDGHARLRQEGGFRTLAQIEADARQAAWAAARGTRIVEADGYGEATTPEITDEIRARRSEAARKAVATRKANAALAVSA